MKSPSRVQLFATPWTYPSMGFSRQEYWSGLPFPSPGDLPDPGIKPRSPTLEADALTSEPPGKLHSAAKIRKNIWHSLGLFTYIVSLFLTMIMWRRLVLLVLSVEKTEVWQLSPGGIARRWQSLYLNSALLGTIPLATVPSPCWFRKPLKGRFVNEGF